MSEQIVSEFGAIISEQLDGLEQSYWDIQIGDITVTLHLEHYLGISLFPAKGFEDNPKVKALIEKIGEKLMT